MKSALIKLSIRYHTLTDPLDDSTGLDPDDGADETTRTEPGFEIAQSMGIALLGLVVAAAFATALQGLGVDVVARIRQELGM